MSSAFPVPAPNLTPKLAAMLAVCALLLAACGSRTQQQAATSAATTETAAQTGTTEPAIGQPVRASAGCLVEKVELGDRRMMPSVRR